MIVMNFLRGLANSPLLNFALGLILVLGSGDEVLLSLSDGLDTGDFNSGMGVTLMGLVHVAKALPDFFEGLGYLERARD